MKQNLWLLALIVLPSAGIYYFGTISTEASIYAKVKQLKVVNAKCDSLQLANDSLVKQCAWSDSAYLEAIFQWDLETARH